MYSTCIFCNKQLGSNEVIETFPVGRRLAFDGVKGRLWVVCRHCERWNLSPLEIRWEAIEECERRFRDTRLRVSTDNIGLARLAEGLELVRLGSPLRPEFAAWRYGDQFGRRRRRAIAYGVAGGTALGLVVVGGAIAGISIGGFGGGFNGIVQAIINERIVARLHGPDGERIKVQGKHLQDSRLHPAEGGPGWELELRHAPGWSRLERGSGTIVVSGDEAVQVVGRLMSRVNRSGGSKKTIQRAVGRIEEAGDPARYLREASRESEQLRIVKAASRRKKIEKVKAGSLRALPSDVRLAIEMATQEQAEREALEGELAVLEAAWREAEEIARIADDLLAPASADEFIRRERERAGEAAGAAGEEVSGVGREA
ncbi:MAG: hypothetical protein ACE5HF_09595 [Gemmatimonadota bacterium]